MAKVCTMILDTCALLWLAAGGAELSRPAYKQIQKSPALYISAITGFEIALKYSTGKLNLPAPPEQWFGTVIEHHGLTVIQLDLQLCIDAANLPSVHDDPCDRLIIATARRHDFTAVTKDERFKAYGIKVIA